MAKKSTLSTAKGGEINIGQEIIDSFFLLDVLHANHFDSAKYDQNFIDEKEKNFYKGAPPIWLNFHSSEKAALSGRVTGIIRRDGYEKLKMDIRAKRKLPAISTVKLFHQSGSGGTTMAMQVLWDLRKTFRCAVLTGSSSNIPKITEEVVKLFTAGSTGNQNTVLLLMNDEQIIDKLEKNIRVNMTENSINACMPVAVILNCVRKETLRPQAGHVFLQRVLSEEEQKQFNSKQKDLKQKYPQYTEKMHGFNIMQTIPFERYVESTCSIFLSSKKAKRPRKNQLVAFLSLLNAYVPGSYLPENLCYDILRNDQQPVEDLVEPFGHLVITFQQDSKAERKVRMAHPLIAKCCTELLAQGGVTRSDTTRNLLGTLCTFDVPHSLQGFVKDMLTKREIKTQVGQIDSSDSKEDKDKFSRLILDITKNESVKQSASVLKMASRVFAHNAFFPQALARLYYIESRDYNRAQMWAKRAMKRDPNNSFIADTYGQVFKNNLKNVRAATPRKILTLARKAIDAFKHQEELAEEEEEADINRDCRTQFSQIFNFRGQFGFLQVCNVLYEKLINQNEKWGEVLTKKVSLHSFLQTLGDNRLHRFTNLIKSLREEVERRSEFFDGVLTYSKRNREKDDPEYISRDTTECHKKYVGNSLPQRNTGKVACYKQKLKANRADTSVGVLACLDREPPVELQEISTLWKKISSKKDQKESTVNYILACVIQINTGADPPLDQSSVGSLREKMRLSNDDPPEKIMLALLLLWATDEGQSPANYKQLIEQMNASYMKQYRKYFRARYLLPLFFIGKESNLNRLVHRKVLENSFNESPETGLAQCNIWANEIILKEEKVKEQLLKVNGYVRNYSVYVTVGGTEVEVAANLQRNLWIPRPVTFYLGFNIRGPVAFCIETKQRDLGEKKQEGAK